jgi:hypothetical protein
MNAEEARKILKEALAKQSVEIEAEIAKVVKPAASSGLNRVYLNVSAWDISRRDQWVQTALGLGYKAEIKSGDIDQRDPRPEPDYLVISW